MLSSLGLSCFCYFLPNAECRMDDDDDLPVHNSMAMKKVDPRQYLPHDVLDPLRSQTWRRTTLNVLVEVLVNMFKYQEQVHLPPINPLSMTNIKQSKTKYFNVEQFLESPWSLVTTLCQSSSKVNPWITKF